MVKKMMVAIIAILIMSGCVQREAVKSDDELNAEETLIINKVDLTKKQAAMLQAVGGDQLFTFELTREKSDEERLIKVTVEHYQNGKLHNTLIDFQTSLSEESATIVVNRHTQSLEEKEYESWNAAIISDSGNSAGSSLPLLPAVPAEGELFSQLANEQSLKLNTPRTIGCILADDKQSMTSSQRVFEGDAEEETRLINEYKNVYFLKVEIGER
jgi:hypothetical protein